MKFTEFKENIQMPSRLAVNPWLSIWTKPRLTIAEIIHTNPSFRFFFLCFIYGFVALLNAGQSASLGNTNSAWAIVLTAAIFGIFIGYLVFSIYSLLLTWTGKWIGERGVIAKLGRQSPGRTFQLP